MVPNFAATRTATVRYTPTAQVLHWVGAALMFLATAAAWVMVNMNRAAPSREWVYTLHKSLGLTVLALVAVRLAWRATHPAPPLPESMARWERAMAFASHWMLYVILVGMPVSGYLVSAASNNAVSYFGLFTVPGLPANHGLSEAARFVHAAVGQWLVYALVVLHIAATVWHVAIRRDGTLDRMLPPQLP